MGIVFLPHHEEAPVCSLAPAGGLTQPAKAFPAVVELYPGCTKLAARFFKCGYVGTVFPDDSIIAKSRLIGQGRRTAAEVGTHRKTDAKHFTLGGDVKGAAGEVLLHWLLEREAQAGLAVFSALLAEVPDKSPDLTLLEAPFDVKTAGLRAAFPDLQTRDDRRLIVNANKLCAYQRKGVEFLLFVFWEGPHVAHLYVERLDEVFNWEIETAPWNAPGGPYRYVEVADVLPLGVARAPQ